MQLGAELQSLRVQGHRKSRAGLSRCSVEMRRVVCCLRRFSHRLSIVYVGLGTANFGPHPHGCSDSCQEFSSRSSRNSLAQS